MKNNNVNLNPWWLTGFTDAEGCFYVLVYKSINSAVGYVVQARFIIELHLKDIDLLLKIQSFFGGVGTITQDPIKNVCRFSVVSIKDITNIIIPHFIQYPLITQKRVDFLLFKTVVELMNKGKHLTLDGIKQIVSLKSTMNLELSEDLNLEFPNLEILERPNYNPDKTILNPNWISGFVDGEGCFNVNINKSKTHKIGTQVIVRFILTQHSRDLDLMKMLVQNLSCGILREDKRGPYIYLTVTKLADINDKVISLFNQFPLQSSKRLEFSDFCKVVELMKSKAHLTTEGLDQIREIVAGMNLRRRHDE